MGQDTQKNRDHWTAKLEYLIASQFEDELVLVVFAGRVTRGLYRIMGKQEPGLEGVYTTQKERVMHVPELERYTSGDGYDVFIATSKFLTQRSHGTTHPDNVNDPADLQPSHLRGPRESIVDLADHTGSRSRTSRYVHGRSRSEPPRQ